MIHYTCDRCKCEINVQLETRYVVSIDIEACDSSNHLNTGDDVDQLSELNETLQGLGQEEGETADDNQDAVAKQFDLCPSCHRAFSENPLGRDLVLPMGFSNN